MRASVVIIVSFCGMLSGQERHAERASPQPREHTAARAGTDKPAGHATTSVTPRNILGYVNGTTFGMDNSLFGRRPGRLFPGLWPEGHKPTSVSQRYQSDGPIHVPDILALKPFRKAVAGAKDDHEHKAKEQAMRTRHTILSLALLGATSALTFGQAPVEPVIPMPMQPVQATQPPAKLPQVDPKKDDKKKDEPKKPPKEDPLPNVTLPAATGGAAPALGTTSVVLASALPAVYGDAGLLNTFTPYLVATTPNGQMTTVPTGQTGTFPLGTTFSQPVQTRIVQVQTGTRTVFDPQTEQTIVVPVFENRVQVVGPPALASKGGIPVNVIRGSFKITENESPRPTDRVYYAFHYFNDVNPTLSVPTQPITNVERHTIGMEKTFLDGNASIGLRVPLLRVTGAGNIAGESVGDLTAIFKYALVNEINQNADGSLSPGNLVSTGLAVTAPTGGTTAYTSNVPVIHSTVIQPWVGAILVRGNSFVQGFSSIAVATDGRDVSYWFNSLQVGTRIYQGGPTSLLTSVTPIIECHVNTPLAHRGLTQLPIGAIDIVSFTGGTTFGIGSRSFLNIGANVPITGPKPYAVEAIAQFNFYW